MADKIFIGRVFTDKWDNPEITFQTEDIQKLQQHLVSGKVKVVLKKSQTKGTWYAEINTFQATGTANPATAPFSVPDNSDTSLPF